MDGETRKLNRATAVGEVTSLADPRTVVLAAKDVTKSEYGLNIHLTSRPTGLSAPAELLVVLVS